MKVVLFCGGFGMRIREYSEQIPKPMVPIGSRPILWHIMRYYAHFGHKEFILCLGHGAESVKNYFLNYNECISNDFVLSNGGKELRLQSADIEDWTITFADTGIHSNIGERLKSVEKYLGSDDVFMANYSDGLTDLPLSDYLSNFQASGRIASLVCVKPGISYHLVEVGEHNLVTSIRDIEGTDVRINGGYFIFSRRIFDYLRPGEELVGEPFRRLLNERQLIGYNYKGFWRSMDTFKDKQVLDDLYARGVAPWEVWKPRQSLKGLPSND